MKTDINYKNDVLSVKLNGVLVGNKINIFESEIIPLILGLKASKVSINLSNLELIDKRGVDSFIKISQVVNRFKGKVVLNSMNSYVKDNLKHTDIFDYCFKSNNEKTSLEVFKI